MSSWASLTDGRDLRSAWTTEDWRAEGRRIQSSWNSGSSLERVLSKTETVVWRWFMASSLPPFCEVVPDLACGWKKSVWPRNEPRGAFCAALAENCQPLRWLPAGLDGDDVHDRVDEEAADLFEAFSLSSSGVSLLASSVARTEDWRMVFGGDGEDDAEDESDEEERLCT